MTKVVQHTIRKMPAKLDQELRRRALEKNQSLNTTLLEVIEEGLGDPQSVINHDFDEFFGSLGSGAAAELEQAMREARRPHHKDYL